MNSVSVLDGYRHYSSGEREAGKASFRQKLKVLSVVLVVFDLQYGRDGIVIRRASVIPANDALK